VDLIGHSMGGLVARAALTHEEGARVTRLVMLGTPNAGSLAAVQALRGTYSVVRKIAQIDLRHDAEHLATHVFLTFPGLHELLPASRAVGALDLFDAGSWPSGPGPASALLSAAAGLDRRMAVPDDRFTMVVGCNRATATRLALREDEFEYEYTLEGDGTVPMSLAKLPGAHHAYVDCGHSDMPLADEVIHGTLDLLEAPGTARFASEPTARPDTVIRVRDSGLRELFNGKVDWPHMTPAQRREFLDTLNEPPWAATRRLEP
jgi:pimeloyl-ACP methyl ester carboxylesterase